MSTFPRRPRPAPTDGASRRGRVAAAFPESPQLTGNVEVSKTFHLLTNYGVVHSPTRGRLPALIPHAAGMRLGRPASGFETERRKGGGTTPAPVLYTRDTVPLRPVRDRCVRLGGLVESFPAFGRIFLAASDDVDALGGLQNGVGGIRPGLVDANGDKRAAATHALGIHMRVFFRHPCFQQSAEDSAGRSTERRADRRGEKPAGRDYRANTGDGQRAKAGQEADASTGRRAQTGARGRIGFGMTMDLVLNEPICIVGDERDVVSSNACVLEGAHRAGCFVVSVE